MERREERKMGTRPIKTKKKRVTTEGREKQRQMERRTEEGPLTAVSKQDGRTLPVERAFLSPLLQVTLPRLPQAS